MFAAVRVPVSVRVPLAALALTLLLASCAGSTAAPESSTTPTEVTLALDWTPNTNHTGFFVAQQKGYYAAAGITLKILPYGSTSPETLVGAGKADFGISFQDGFSFARAAGQPITSVAAILQHIDTVIAVRGDSAITTPTQLDGKVYAGFGAPSEDPMMKYVIKHAGGKGEFKTVTLGDSSVYDAVYAGRADFAQAFIGWEVIEAKLTHKPLRTFKLTDYGVPDRYDVILIGGDDWLSAHSALAKRFVQATARGFTDAAKDPAAAADLLIKANPALAGQSELVKQSAAVLASSFYLDPAGRWGTQTLAEWKGFSGFLYQNGVLVDAGGNKLTAEPDFAGWFSNQYLTGG